MTLTQPADPDALATAIRRGDRRELARAITLVESERLEDRALAASLIDSLLLQPSHAARFGISGPPGVGKSTLIEALGIELLKRGRKVAVLAIDPSSEISGGSLLADKTRMPTLARSLGAYVRPSPSRLELGGVGARTEEACVLCAAAGFDTVIVETVGVGQSEHRAKYLVDCLVVLALPGSGDELQGMKRGLFEHADLLVVNKADGENLEAARRAQSELDRALQLSSRRGGAPSVLLTSAVEGTGVAELVLAADAWLERCRANGEHQRRLAQRRREWARALVKEGVLAHFFDSPVRRRGLESALTRIGAEPGSPYVEVRAVLEAWLGPELQPSEVEGA